MAYEVHMGGQVLGTLGQDGKMNYDVDHAKGVIREQIAGQQATKGKTTGSFFTTVKVVYKFDRNRLANNDAIYSLWKSNPLVQNRLRQLNALVFGRGFSFEYDDATKAIIDRFWKVNTIKSKLNPMGTDAQLFGEVFIGMIPQPTGDVLVAIYESNKVVVDFNPSNVDDINFYAVGYNDEEQGKDVQQKYLPLYKYLNNVEFANSPVQKVVKKVKSMLSGGKVDMQGMDGVMIHIKFNNSSAEVHGTSDFRQVYSTVNDYMDFRADRMAIHQLYGSPMFDIEIDTDDEQVILDRVEQLAGFTIGSNPVHNSKEKWTPLEFRNSADSAQHDEKAMRGLLCAGMGFPEHLLFNQPSEGGQDNSGGEFALNKIAEDMQDAFGDAFTMIHKFVVSVGGGDITKVDEGRIIFPEISTMSEKAKAETYVLKVGANICSRQTAAYNLGHDWTIEEQQMQLEKESFGVSSDIQGAVGGRFTSRVNNQDPNRDDGTGDRKARAKASNVSTQVMGDRKTNN